MQGTTFHTHTKFWAELLFCLSWTWLSWIVDGMVVTE